MHTSPLAQPGRGDGGGMNVYVRELAAALARSGVRCEVFTRAEDPTVPAVVDVEPGFRVHHVPAGPLAPVAKEALPDLVDEWADGVRACLARLAAAGRPAEATHAASEPARRAEAEAWTMGCSDAVLASCTVEADQLVELYEAPRERIRIVAPGVEHAFFAPGQRRQARRAIGADPDRPLVLFVGRIQPLKGLSTAVEALGLASAAGGRSAEAQLVVVGGPSGVHGDEELRRAEAAIAAHHLEGRVRQVPAQAHHMLSTYFRAADVCLVPSRSESFGLVALEAAACGT